MVRAVLAILVWLPLCLTLSSVVAAAEPDSIAEPSQIVWMADVTKAWEISQQRKQPLIQSHMLPIAIVQNLEGFPASRAGGENQAQPLQPRQPINF
jgi:hypothetical protein